MAIRPRLKQYFQVFHRGDSSVQLGVTGDSGGVLVAGLEPAEIAFLQRLDGTASLERLADQARAAGIPSERWDALVRHLETSGVLVTAPTDRAWLAQLPGPWRDLLASDAATLAVAYGGSSDAVSTVCARRRQRVVVCGAEGLAFSLAGALRGDGIGVVEVTPDSRGVLDHRPDLVVVAAHGALDTQSLTPLTRHGIPHLPLVVDGPRIVVGPLAAHDPAAPCARCLDLHRTDRDPAWPMILAQVLHAPRGHGGQPAVSGESSLVRCGTAIAVMFAQTFLAGQAIPTGVSLEVSLPFPVTVTRRWSVHPRCPDHFAQRLT